MARVIACPHIDLTGRDERQRLLAAFSVTQVRRGAEITVLVGDTTVDVEAATTLAAEAGQRAITLRVEGSPGAVAHWCDAIAPTHRQQYLRLSSGDRA